MQRKRVEIAIAALCLLLARSIQSENGHRFSVNDDIELTQFGDLYRPNRGAVVVSPTGGSVAVHTTRASLDDGKLHDQLRIYDMEKLRRFVNSSDPRDSAEPFWIIDESTATEGQDQPLITNLRWLRDGSGVAFLLRSAGHRKLHLALIGSRDVVPLSPEGDDVLSFDIRDRSHYVFTVASSETKETLAKDLQAPFRIATGHRIYETMFPEVMALFVGRGDLWAANGESATPVRDAVSGKTIILYQAGNNSLTLSPDGSTLVTVMAVAEIPLEWETRFQPPFPNDGHRLRAGLQDLNAPADPGYAGEYVKIDLASGKVTSLTNAPTAMSAGWFESLASPAWSDDGSSVLLSGTFDRSQNGDDLRPCIAVIRIPSGTHECVKTLKRNLAEGFEDGYQRIDEASFARYRNDQVLLRTLHTDRKSEKTELYSRSDHFGWHLRDEKSEAGQSEVLDVMIKATYKDSPLLVATDRASKTTRTIFNPNQQLENIVMGSPELYRWTDGAGHTWQGVLYKPVGYRTGIKYPLVIQNHGFSVDRFAPSGGPSAFVAQELASEGIMVLHVRDCDGRGSPTEGPCNVREYEAAVESLSKDGMIDSSRVGLIGFSRTVFYVLEALTTSKIRFRAASVTDGITVSYMEWLSAIDPGDAYRRDAESLIGSSPLGQGIMQWLSASPGFNMEKV